MHREGQENMQSFSCEYGLVVSDFLLWQTKEAEDLYIE